MPGPGNPSRDPGPAKRAGAGICLAWGRERALLHSCHFSTIRLWCSLNILKNWFWLYKQYIAHVPWKKLNISDETKVSFDHVCNPSLFRLLSSQCCSQFGNALLEIHVYTCKEKIKIMCLYINDILCSYYNLFFSWTVCLINHFTSLHDDLQCSF